MTLRHVLSAAALGALFCAAAPARADNNADAKEHFKRGQTHYALGEFTDAVSEFREAYRLRDEPAILFNIAQAMRQLGNVRQAYFYYSQYLSRRADASNRAEVEQFMALMKKKIDADEEADRMRKEAELSRPPPVHYPEDQLDEGDGSGATRGAAVPDPSARAKQGEVTAVKKPSGTPPGKGKPAEVAAAKTRPAAAASPAVTPPPPPVKSAVAAAAFAPAASAPAPAESVVAAPAPLAGSGGHGLRYAGIAALGVGAGAGVLAYVFHSSAQSSADALSQKYQNGTLRPSDSSLKNDIQSKGQLSTVAAIGAGVLVAAGAALVFAF